ncbi:MAG TPA: TIGR02147 family protein, partial [Bdellovibrionota bacterium]|nr:TIGR02147 family protein [Bdellovibrionota bacterium]
MGPPTHTLSSPSPTPGVLNGSASGQSGLPASLDGKGLDGKGLDGKGVVLSKGERVNIFEFTDYRTYLKAFYETKKVTNPAYSMSTFTRRAGLGHNSRGYLKLIIEGKRNLTPHTVRRFADALGLQPREALYFENLVYFNQAKTPKDKDYYFQRVSISTAGRESKPFELLRSQYQFYSNWYYVAVWSLAGLPSFNEDPEWI